ncbi:MAG: Hsp20/alpha crystallin family protein [Verrucomicrobiales bacterium]|nr:Hsp20/alpha crystallin family protein [Verrucomicrobiae bacterium]
MNQTLTTWNPFRDLTELSNRLNSLAGNQCGASGKGRCATGDWLPSVDIHEDENGYTIHADLPRVDKDNVTLTFSDRVLTVEGERKSEEKSEGSKVHLVERSYGRFVRSFRLPEDANGEAIKATFKEGVLTINVPKREETKPKSIAINVD